MLEEIAIYYGSERRITSTRGAQVMKTAISIALSFLSVVSLVVFSQTPSKTITERHIFGDGEMYSETTQPWHPCGTDPDTAAQNICSMYLPDGKIENFNFTVDRTSVRAGNRCGYRTYTVVCYEVPSVAAGRSKVFKIGELNADHACRTDPVTVAKNFCTLKGPKPKILPFTVRRTHTVDGNECGYNTYEVKCRETP